MRALLADRLRGRPTRANFRTGHLTICTLVPMRSVPHRVVCLLGLDDGVFPRKAPRDGDDLMLDDPHVGDRDPRSEDRQLLLDALLAATDRLIITYTGNDERTNVPRAAGRAGRRAARRRRRDGPAPTDDARDAVVVQHPLQPFDPRNFEPDGSMPGRTWSFDRVDARRARAPWRASAPIARAVPRSRRCRRATRRRGRARRPRAVRPAPGRARSCAGGSASALGDCSDEVDDALPVELDALEKWGVGAAAARRSPRRRRPASPRSPPRSRAATLPPGVLARAACSRECRPDRRGDRPPRPRRLPAPERSAASVDVRVALARRPRCSVGTVAGRPRRRPAHRDLLARARRSTGSRPGCGCSRSPRRTRSGASRPSTVGRGSRGSDRHRRPCAIARSPTDAGERARAGAAPPRVARRSLRPRHARAAAALLPDLRRVRGRRSRAGKDPVAAAGEGLGVGVELRRRRTRSPSTSSCSAASGRSTTCWPSRRGRTSRATAGTATEPTRFGPLRAAALGRPARPRGGERPMSRTRDAAPFDLCGAAADRRDGARGERRHRQDLRDRRARRALRRRGHAARPAAARDVHADGHRRAARARPRTAGQRRARRSPVRSPACAPDADDEVRRAARRGRRRRGAAPARAARARDRPTSTPPPSPRRTASARTCSAVSASRATSSPTRRSSRTSRDLVDEVVDDLYVRRFHRDAARRRSTVPRPLRDRPGRDRATRRAPIEPPTRRGRPRRRCAAGWRAAVRDELELRKRRSGVMTYDDLLTRLRDTLAGADGEAAALRGCARATPSCWSTSSRTPTRAVGDPRSAPSARATTTLVLIGDPKQAIYAFRGADVYAYLDARERRRRARRSTSTGAATRG